MILALFLLMAVLCGWEYGVVSGISGRSQISVLSRASSSIGETVMDNTVVGSDTSESKSKPFNVSVITWNLSELSPTKKDCLFMNAFQDSDIIICGVQECEDIRPRRHEGSRSKKWRQLQNNYFPARKGFVCAARHRMGGIQLAVYVKPRALNALSNVQVFDVPCGVGNVMANKGAVCMVLQLGKQTLALVNAHMAADHKMVSERNKHYARIMSELVTSTSSLYNSAMATTATSTSPKTAKKKRTSHVTLKGGRALKKIRKSNKKRTASSTPSSSSSISSMPFDAILYFGDFNYRIELPRPELEKFHKKYNKAALGSSSSRGCFLEYPLSRLASTMKQPEEREQQQQQQRPVSDQEVTKFRQDILSLFEFDQLKREQRRGRVFHGFKEGEIMYPPTYKYDKRSIVFDTSEKNRIPAWTDRILFKQREPIGIDDDSTSTTSCNPSMLTLRRYGGLDIRSSDHRPVFANFDLNIDKS